MWRFTIVALAACGRIGFAPTDSGATLPDAPLLPDETLVAPDGWSADVWFDFSSRFVFDPAFYDDPPRLYSNRPHRLVLLEPPFPEGLVLVAPWDLYEMRQPDVFVAHRYFQAFGASGPDALWEVWHCDDWMSAGTANGLCIGAGSQSAGDGVFRVEADWSMTLIDPVNNAGGLFVDRAGTFDGHGSRQVYVGGPLGIRRHLAVGSFDTAVKTGDFNGGFTTLARNGDMLAAELDTSETSRTLYRIASGSHAQTVLGTISSPSRLVNVENDGRYAIVGGDPSALPGDGYVIADARRLLELQTDNTLVEIASTDPAGGWVWSHAVVAPPGHPLSNGGPVFYLLEYNPNTEQNRVVRLLPN